MSDGFRKQRRRAPVGFFATEAAGLRWLDVPGGPRVARVLAVGEDYLDLERIVVARPTASAAEAFGGQLARLHDAGAAGWGTLPPGAAAGYFGPLDDPLPMPGGDWPDWPTFYAQARLSPILDQGRERRVFGAGDAELFAAVSARLPRLIGPALDDQPARLHGDLWSGNLLWTSTPTELGVVSTGGATGGSEAVLIDPAAHGGHRECDLAMLALFGAPHLDQIIAGYQRQHPLAPGWQQRIALHQLYPVAVHAVLFGGGYIHQTRQILRRLAA